MTQVPDSKLVGAESAPRIVTIIERRSVVAIYAHAQRDEPPGRPAFRGREVVLASRERTVEPEGVEFAIRTTLDVPAA